MRRQSNSASGEAAATPPSPPPKRRPSRILIEDLYPVVDCGRYRPKRVAGDRPTVSATIVRDGHDVLRAAVQWRAPGATRWREAQMRRVDAAVDGDRWSGEIGARFDRPLAVARDRLERPFRELARGAAAQGRGRAARARLRARGGRDAARGRLRACDRRGSGRCCRGRCGRCATTSQPEERRRETALGADVLEAAAAGQERHDCATSATQEIDVERERARFGSWYELFPRSWGGFEGVRAVLPEIAAGGLRRRSTCRRSTRSV